MKNHASGRFLRPPERLALLYGPLTAPVKEGNKSQNGVALGPVGNLLRR